MSGYSKNNIYEIFGTDAHEMTKALMEAAQVSDSIPKGASECVSGCPPTASDILQKLRGV